MDNRGSPQVQILDMTSRLLGQELAFSYREYSHVAALSSDGSLLASDVDADCPLPTQVRLTRNDTVLNPDICLRSCCIERDFDFDTVTCIKFFPDGRKIFVTRCRDYSVRRGTWLTEFDVPENLWSNGGELGSSPWDKPGGVEASNYSSDEKKSEGNIEVRSQNPIELLKNASEESTVNSMQGNNPFFQKSSDSDDEDSVEKNGEPDNSGKGNISFCRREEQERVDMTSGSSESGDEEERDGGDSSNEDSREGDISESTAESDGSDENTSRLRDNVQFTHYDLNVITQGYSIPPPPPDSSSESEYEFDTAEEYHNWKHLIRVADQRNLFTYQSGFYCLAISPDTTRLLTGNHDGEAFVIDEDSFDVLQHIQACKKDTVVTGCHYNPLFAHDEFATCGGDAESSVLKIWSVENFEDGTEKASCLHSLPLKSMPVNCCYSPDGQLVAVKCENLETYIVCPQSGVVMYTLTFEREIQRPIPGIGPHSSSITFFAGRTCQVVTAPNHKNYSVAIWNVPVVYSLETLCSLIVRATVSYTKIDDLYLPIPLKERLKYLYV
jgi:hypothetical protein